MNVALIGPASPLRGGIARYNDVLADELRRRRHSVLQVSFERLYPNFLFPGRSQFDASLGGGTSLPVLRPLIPWSWRRASAAIRDFGAHVSVLHWWHPFFFAVTRSLIERCRQEGVPVLALCHNVLPHESAPFQRVLTRWALAASSAAVVHAGALGAELQQLLPRLPTTHCFHPIVVGAEHPAPSNDVPEILFFGYVRPYKGLSVLLEAFAAVRRERAARLRIAGEFYEDPKPYLEQICRLGIQQDVELENRFVPEAEVGAYFARADVVVLPYLSATQSGIVPLAFGHGVPVISTATGGLAEVVESGKTGFLVAPGSASELASALIQFFREGRSVEFRDNIRGFSSRLNWDCVVSCIERLSGAVDEKKV
ncbi:MAG: glycosyltransferase [Acidobacteriota bacterium]